MKFEDMINTIQLGDCYELIKQIPDKSIDLVYIDIPYLFKAHGGGTSELAKRSAKNRSELVGLKYDESKSTAENMRNANHNKGNIKDITSGIDYSIFDELCRIMKNIHIYIWCSKDQILDIMDYFINKKCCVNDLLVWCKTNPIPVGNNTFLPDVEYCLFFREPNKTKLNDGYELKSKWYISPINKGDKELYKHPTIKPLELVKRHILHSTQPNDIVLDCFCGSGTTCLASKETGRRYIGMEIDPNYHKIAVNRLNGILANGQTSIFTDFDNLGESNE